MSEQQQGGSRALVPGSAVNNSQNGPNGFPPAPNPFTSSALRALPPLPHPDLLADASSALLVDLRRQMDHLSRLADKIEQHGLGEAPPAPPSSIALVPIPHVPANPTLSHKPAIVAAAAATQTVRARIKRRPKPSGRYSGEMVHPDGSSGQHALRGGEGMAAESSGLQRVLNRFNAIQAAEYAAESSAMGAARSAGSVCRIETEVGRSDTLRIAWNGLEDKASKQGIRPKRRRTDHHRLMAQVRLDVGEMHEANAEIAAMRRVVRTIRFKPSQVSLGASGPSGSAEYTADPETSASDPTASEHLLANLLSSQHLSLAELLDRLPHLPTILSSPCIFCSSYIRPPDGLPLQGIGFLPEKHAKITMSPQSSQSEHLTNGQMIKTDLTKTVGNIDLDEAEATGKDDRNQRETGVEDEGRAKGDSKAHRPSGVGRESSGRWANWHACCDV